MIASQYDIPERNDFGDDLLKGTVQFLLLYWIQVVDVESILAFSPSGNEILEGSHWKCEDQDSRSALRYLSSSGSRCDKGSATISPLPMLSRQSSS
jgi:hypothetical protein